MGSFAKRYFCSMERFFWVDVTFACFGIVAIDNRITEVAPIASWMKGKTLQQIKPWLLRKKATVIEIKKSSGDEPKPSLIKT